MSKNPRKKGSRQRALAQLNEQLAERRAARNRRHQTSVPAHQPAQQLMPLPHWTLTAPSDDQSSFRFHLTEYATGQLGVYVFSSREAADAFRQGLMDPELRTTYLDVIEMRDWLSTCQRQEIEWAIVDGSGAACEIVWMVRVTDFLSTIANADADGPTEVLCLLRVWLRRILQ